MSDPAGMFLYEYLADDDILIGKFLIDKVDDKDEAKLVYDYAIKELANQSDAKGFIMDALSLNNVSSYSIGTLMKTLEHMQKTKGYMILLLKEPLLQEIMIQHPVMFDFFAVFHNRQDAIEYINKNS